MSTLEEIVAHKTEEVAALKKKYQSSSSVYQGVSFFENIATKNGLSVIAEIKKASPSRGLIKDNFDPVAIANNYEKGGAKAISVLTDVDYFQGSLEYLRRVRDNCRLPILRKDFIIDPIQIDESIDYGASAILLIVSILDREKLHQLYQMARSKNLDVLLEVHDKKELDIALDLNPRIIGVNNRNLNTFEIDIENVYKLKKYIPKDIVLVCESGIQNAKDIEKLAKWDISCILVGTSLMQEEVPSDTISLWMKEYNKARKKGQQFENDEN